MPLQGHLLVCYEKHSQYTSIGLSLDMFRFLPTFLDLIVSGGPRDLKDLVIIFAHYCLGSEKGYMCNGGSLVIACTETLISG